MDLEKRLEAQQVKADVMAKIGGSPERGTFETEFQSFVDKNYPPPSPTELIQEAKSRIMHDAGQVHPGSFEAKFQEFADTNYPKIGFQRVNEGGQRSPPTSPQNTHKRFSDESKAHRSQKEQPVGEIGFEPIEKGLGRRAH